MTEIQGYDYQTCPNKNKQISLSSKIHWFKSAAEDIVMLFLNRFGMNPDCIIRE